MLLNDKQKEDVTKANELVVSIVSDYTNESFKILEEFIRLNAVPKIKGDITKRKLDTRGISVCSRMDDLGITKWIEQNGKRISPQLIIEFPKGRVLNF